MSKKEVKELEINEDKNTFNLEDLIIEGTKVEIPITFDYPTNDGFVPVSAIIRPISSVEWNNTLQKYSKNLNKFAVAILNIGLLSNDGEQISVELLEKMPAGIVDDILRQIQDLSGIKQDKQEQYELTKELMGF